MIKVENLPREIRENALFCLWRRQDAGQKTKKVPFQVDGQPARSNDRSCFCSFEEALKVAEDYDGVGIGIFDGYSAIDIDNCVDDAGNLSPMAQDIVDEMASYTELSPSGHGIRILFLSSEPYNSDKYYIMRHDIGLEVYVSGATSKYVTVTSDRINVYDVHNCDSELTTVCERYMLRPAKSKVAKTTGAVMAVATSGLSDSELIDKAGKARNGGKFTALMVGDTSAYSSANEADYALCGILAFWANGDEEQIDRIFRSSGLMRPKWDRAQSGSTYGRITIRKAIKNVPAFYEPPAPKRPRSQIGQWLIDHDAINCYEHNDIGTSRLFADINANSLRYVNERKLWYYYNGHNWRADEGKNIIAHQRCKEIVVAMISYAMDTGNKEYLAYCYSLTSQKKREIIMCSKRKKDKK